MQRVLLIGMSHATAPLALRERLVLSAAAHRAALERFRSAFPGCEVVLLSTCNRAEIYAARPVHAHPRPAALIEFLAQFHGVASTELRGSLYEKAQRDAVEHLFRVAAGIDSMVPGESQILGQVRDGYEMSRELNCVGPMLNPVFQRALAAGKEAQSIFTTGARGPNIASLAVDFGRRAIGSMGDKSVLTIGSGEMIHIVLDELAAHRPSEIVAANRDDARIRAAAEAVNGRAIALDLLPQALPRADLVITCTAAPAPILRRDDFERAAVLRGPRKTVVIDLAVPRDVDPAVRDLPHVRLCDFDELQAESRQQQGVVDDRFDRVERVIADQVDSFLSWDHARQLGPAIDALYRRYHELAGEELTRTLGALGDVSDHERERLSDLVRRIVNKLLHDPVSALRDGDSLQSPALHYTGALRKLFKLDLPDEPR